MPAIYLHLDGNQVGPYTPEQVRQLLAEGKITADSPAWREGMTEWSTVAVLVPPPAPPVRAGGPPPYAATMVQPPGPAPRAESKGMSAGTIAAIIFGAALVLVVPCCAGIALGPITAGIHKAKESASMQSSRAIGLAMFSYASDHNGNYPDGKTSTEVFQKLIDGKYVSDPAIFYLQMPGKTKATSMTLTADNVCYDVTSGVTGNSSDQVPVVFCTGYTVTYTAGASAVRDTATQTPFPGPENTFRGLAVTYKSNFSRFIPGDAEGTVAGFIPASFSDGGKTYQQLKP